jgi:dipeptidyl aminopeptidase/acylaminoacyl peptidase
LNYLLYFPANFDPHKKYPVVIGGTPFWAVSRLPHGRPWLPPIATCGAFVATVDRADWFNGIEKWGDNVSAVYKNLIKNPCIDANRAYLFSSSAETTYMGRFMAQSPGLWRGGILLNPTGLPDFSQSPSLQPKPKLLIIAGGEEHEEERFNQYQQEALKSGVITEVVLAPEEGHRFVGKAAHIQRLQALERFIFEQ